ERAGSTSGGACLRPRARGPGRRLRVQLTPFRAVMERRAYRHYTRILDVDRPYPAETSWRFGVTPILAYALFRCASCCHPSRFVSAVATDAEGVAAASRSGSGPIRASPPGLDDHPPARSSLRVPPRLRGRREGPAGRRRGPHRGGPR